MNLQESIRRIIKEVRVPRSERVELYKDDNIIVVVPLTHRALQKYAHQCLWCINDDIGEWEDYHKGKHAVIIQRNPKKPKIGITGQPVPSEIFLLSKWDNNQSSFEDVCQMLDYEFRNDRTMSDYYVTISNNINNFATNIVYYSPENGVYDQEDNFLWNFNIEINDIPNVKPKVIEIMDDYLQEEEEMSIQESIRRILREELSPRVRRRIDPDEMEKEFLESFDSAYNLTKRRKVLSTHFLDDLIYTTISMMMDGYHWRFTSTLPEDEFWYDDIHTELENHYRDRIIQMYNERRGINESILREEKETEFSTPFKRRLGRFTSFVWDNNVINYPCDFENFDSFIHGIHAEVMDMVSDGSDTDGPLSDWLTYIDAIRYIQRYMLDDLKEYYNRECVKKND